MPSPSNTKSAAFGAALDEAKSAHQNGRFADAAARYEPLLQAAPGDGQLHYLLGAAYLELGRFSEALALLERAVSLRPGDIPSLEMLGSAWTRSGAPEKAAAPFREAARLGGNKPEALARLANVLRKAKQYTEARETFRRVLLQDPSHRHSQFGLAMCHAHLGDIVEAERSLRAWLVDHPGDATALTTLATVLAQAGRFAEAEHALRGFLATTPSHREARKLLANTVHKQGRADEAEMLYRGILSENPGDTQIALQLAEGLIELARPDDAEAVLISLRQSAPDNAGALTALGRVYELRGDPERAIALHSAAIAKDGKSENAYTNRGSARRFAGDYSGALADYDAALALDPHYAPAIANRGLTYLTLGRLAEAWPAYRSRIKALHGAPDLTADKPWDGSALNNKRVLVWLEYGLGDEILFASLLPQLLDITAHCTVVCSPRLRALLRRSFPRATVVGMGEPIHGDFDVRLPLTDAAEHLRTDLEAFPPHTGYLKADETLTADLRRRYARPDRPLLVGLSWRSASGGTGRFKSMDLAQWSGILRAPGVSFVSLQYGDSAADIAHARAATGAEIIADPDIDSAGDLDRFAAQVAAMDLVISVSNTTVHVAGALGRPVWTLVPEGSGAHWYWFRGRADSPWYPSARLFRQDRPGDWAKPLADVTLAFEAWRVR